MLYPPFIRINLSSISISIKGDFIVKSNRPAKLQGFQFDIRYGDRKYLIHYLDDSKPAEWISEREVLDNANVQKNDKCANNAVQCVRDLALASQYMDVYRLKWKIKIINVWNDKTIQRHSFSWAYTGFHSSWSWLAFISIFHYFS